MASRAGAASGSERVCREVAFPYSCSLVAAASRRGRLRRRRIGSAGRGRARRGRSGGGRRCTATWWRRPTRTSTTVQGALGTGNGHEPKVFYLRYADGSETHTAQLRRLHGHGAQVRVQLRADAGRVPAPDPGVPRRVVRRLQHRLHADPADERQVLHRGGLLGRRRLVQGRRQGRGRRAVPVQGPERRRRLHVPGRPQRARDGGHHRAGAGAPARARAHDQPARHHVPDHQHRHRRLRRRRQRRSPAIAATARRRTRTR